MLLSEGHVTVFLSVHFIIPHSHCFECVLMLLEGISWGNKPENPPKLGQTKAQSSTLGIQLKVLTVSFFLK